MPADPKLDLYVVDVFSATPMNGNPAAIVVGGANLPTEMLQRTARFLNLSETVFLLPPTDSEADFRARTFTVRREIPFAGHATLAAAHIHAATGGQSLGLVQQCDAGLIAVEKRARGSAEYTIALPSGQVRESGSEACLVAEALDLPLTAITGRAIPVASAGPAWMLAELGSADFLGQIDADFAAVAQLTRSADAVGLVAYALGEGNIVRLRAFAPAEGILEDPVCGSCAGAIGAYLASDQGVSEFLMEQGHEIGRAGVMLLQSEETAGGLRLKLTGHCRTVVTGQLCVE